MWGFLGSHLLRVVYDWAFLIECKHNMGLFRYTIGWLRSVGSIKLQVSFAEYSLFYKALLQKRPIILSILLTKATPYRASPM